MSRAPKPRASRHAIAWSEQVLARIKLQIAQRPYGFHSKVARAASMDSHQLTHRLAGDDALALTEMADIVLFFQAQNDWDRDAGWPLID